MNHSFKLSSETPTEDKELMEPGWYNFRIDAAYDTSPDGSPLETSAGIPYIRMTCAENEGGTVSHCLFLDPEQSKKVYFFLQATGCDAWQDEEVQINPDMFVGKTFRGRVEIKGEYNRIIRTNPIPETTPKEVEEKALDPELEQDVPF